MRCLGVKDLALGHEDTSFCFPYNHVDILYLPLCIHSLSSPLCSVPKGFWLGPGMGTLWQKIRGQTEWSPIFVPMPSHQDSASLAEGQGSYLVAHPVWLTSQNQEFFLPLAYLGQGVEELPPAFLTGVLNSSFLCFLQLFSHLINIPLLKVLVCLLLGPTFRDSCGNFAGCTHPAARRKLGSGNAFVALFMLNPHHREGSWFWLSLSLFWKVTLLHLFSCLPKCPNWTWKAAPLPNFHFRGGGSGGNLPLNWLGIWHTKKVTQNNINTEMPQADVSLLF